MILSRYALAAGLCFTAPAVFAQQAVNDAPFRETLYLSSPRPLAYTDFAQAPLNPSAAHFAALYGNEPELIAPGVAAFEGHAQFVRPNGVTQELTIFYSARLCATLRTTPAGLALSRCPARLIAYSRARAPRTQTFTDICLVHHSGRPPTASDVSRNGATFSIRKSDSGATLVLSAIVNGETAPECARLIPIGKGDDA